MTSGNPRKRKEMEGAACDAMGLLMMLLSLLGLAIVVAVVVGTGLAVRALFGGPREETQAPQLAADPAHAELRRRYAAGEITREDYLQAKADLE